jgi:hypothetical protein
VSVPADVLSTGCPSRREVTVRVVPMREIDAIEECLERRLAPGSLG